MLFEKFTKEWNQPTASCDFLIITLPQVNEGFPIHLNILNIHIMPSLLVHKLHLFFQLWGDTYDISHVMCSFRPVHMMSVTVVLGRPAGGLCSKPVRETRMYVTLRLFNSLLFPNIWSVCVCWNLQPDVDHRLFYMSKTDVWYHIVVVMFLLWRVTLAFGVTCCSVCLVFDGNLL